MKKKLPQIVIFISISIFLYQCVTSPTGRQQLTFVSKKQMEDMGNQAFSELKDKIKRSNDPNLISYIKCIVDPLLTQVPSMPNLRTTYAKEQWEIEIFIDESANAFALPGAKIGVHTGLLKVAKTDAQLAAVLGHEIAHVLANHGNERVSHALAMQGGLEIAGVILKDNPKKDTILGLLGIGTQYGVLLPYSRTQETEADILGQDLMAKAGFDPEQSVELWKNMMAATKSAPAEFLSTHPSSAKRILKLKSRLEQTKPMYLEAINRGLKPVCKLNGYARPL